MSIQTSSSGLDNLLLQVLQQQHQTTTTAPVTKKTTAQKGQDIVALSGQKPKGHNLSSDKHPKLISENIQDTVNGFRRTQEFENSNGRKFTKTEEITTTANRSKRIVIQQNESGSTTALENILDRQEDGTFRLIQRYTDEAGITKTNVTPEFNPIDADILLGRAPTHDSSHNNPFQPTRGTQIDLRV